MRKRKNYFEIPAFLQIERGNSRAGKFKTSNENKNTNKPISVAAKCNITLNFSALDIPHSIGSIERWEFQNNFSCSVPYHI